MLSPVILFTYNRPTHTKKTLEALSKNSLSYQTELFIFSDAAKNQDHTESVQEVRQYLKTVSGFKAIHVIERDSNYGLAKNIIEGVTSIISQFGKIIVLEDDIVVSSNFLSYMNDALNFYKDIKKVWHITAYQYPITTNKLKNSGTAFSRLVECWSWATWDDRWIHFEKKPQEIINTFSKKEIYNFDFHPPKNQSPFWNQVLLNQKGTINTWAIFWYATIFKNKGLCLEPLQTFVQNIGLDGEGTHYTQEDYAFFHQTISPPTTWKFNKKIKENKLLFREQRRIFYPNDKKETIKKKNEFIFKLKYYLKSFLSKSFKEKTKSIIRLISRSK